MKGGVAYSPSGTQSGFSTQVFGVIEGNSGWGPSAGASVNVNKNGIAGGKGVLPRVGAGYGFMSGAGAGGSATYVFNDPLWCK